MLTQARRWLRRGLGIVLVVLMISLGGRPAWGDSTVSPGPLETGANQPAQLFAVHCVGCHANGGNIICRGKTLRAKALKRYGYEDRAAIATIITNGKGVMSAYQDRLTPEQINALAGYVEQQAATGW